MALPVLDEKHERGVRNPLVVDMISSPEESDEVILLMLEDRPWGADAEQVTQVEEKFNNYLDYALDGHLGEQFPQYKDKIPHIRLECLHEPTDVYVEMFEAMLAFAKSASIVFSYEVVSKEVFIAYAAKDILEADSK